jgi:hypothetical protein
VATQLRARVLPEADYDLWNEFVRASPEGTVYATPSYLDALCRATGGRFRVVVVEKGDEPVGGLAAYEETQSGLRSIAPRLLLYYHSPVLLRYDTRYPSERTSRYLKVWTALTDWIDGQGFDRVILKCAPGIVDVRAALARNWSARPGYTYVVPVTDLDDAWGRVEQNLRRLVQRSEKSGLVFAEDDDFDGFYRLHEATMDRKDQATYLSRERFQRYWEALRGEGLATLMHARLSDGRSVASQLVLLGDLPVAQTVSAAADPEYLALGANPFLRWRGFEALSAKGYQAVDLTDAALNPVTRFKSQLGGDLTLSMVVEQKESRRWRQRAALKRGARRLRGAAGRIVRGLPGRGRREAP